MQVTTTAPCRADLAGGTLDIWPLGVLHPGAVTVNVAVPVMVRLEVSLDGVAGRVDHRVGSGEWRQLGPEIAVSDLTAAVCFALRPGGGLRVRVLEQAPLRSGLGGSSSYAVALARAVLALDRRTMNERSLVALARDLEARVLSVPTGIQDHWAAIRGGAIAVHMQPGAAQVEPLEVDRGWLAERFSLFFTGITHNSGMVNWEVIRRRLEGDRATTDALDAIVDAATRCREALLRADDRACGAAIAAEWKARKRLAPQVSPPEVEHLAQLAVDAGATAVKACGAGGGGTLLMWHEPERRESLAEALATAAPAGRMLASGVMAAGCEVD